MPSPLGSIYSTADSFKRKLLDMITNPVDAAQQVVGNANDRASLLNALTSQAAIEGLDGGPLMGPKSQQLAGMMADAYNPAGIIGANIAAKAMPETKAVNTAGLPNLVYRGSRMGKSAPLEWSEARQRQTGKGGDTGQWFSDNPTVANSYAGARGQENYVAPAYLDMRNPLVVDASGNNWGEIPKTALGDLGDRIRKDVLTTDEIARIAKSQGYDGVQFKNLMDVGPAGEAYEIYRPSNVYVTFNPQAARSALSDEELAKAAGIPTNKGLLQILERY